MMKDHIEREATLNAILDMHCKADGDGYVWILLGDAVRRIDNLPSAEPERKKGKWEWASLSSYNEQLQFPSCSVCNGIFTSRFNYCPNCGAEMERE